MPEGQSTMNQDGLPAALTHAVEQGRDKLYTLGEEVAHALTHGLGVVLAIAGLTVMVARATLYGDAWHIVGASIFGTTLVLMYTASTLYHSIPLPKAKKVLRIIDHSTIYLLIAGTYTPLTLITLNGTIGWTMFGIVWGLALVGVVFKIFATGKFEKLSLGIYLGMGWCILIAAKPLVETMPLGGLILLAAGGLAYSGGVAFYVWERLRYHHAIWHGFVLAGSVLQYFAVLFYVIPGPA
ncbi:MAG TPA: hemolysin III family protein [Verrucomicrobiae bacterium]|nr:hemolysin III family protein [Verrucomicrobiae bacterium]